MRSKEKFVKRVVISFVAVAFVVLLMTGAAQAASWPEKGKLLTVYVASGAGGGIDIPVRALCQFLEPELGVKIVVINKPGGGSQVGVQEFLAKSGTDGYTLIAASTPSFHAPYLDPARKATYSRKDLLLAVNYAQTPVAVGVKKGSRFKTLKDLVEAARANPGKIKASSGGPLFASDYAIIALEKAAGVSFAHMFFDQQGEQRANLLGGHVDCEFNFPMDFISGQKTGETETLAVFDEMESAHLPGVKTAAAQGYKAYLVNGQGLAFKAGTPNEIADALAAAVKKVAANPEFQKIFDKLGLVIRVRAGQEYADYWKSNEILVQAVLDDMKKKK